MAQNKTLIATVVAVSLAGVGAFGAATYGDKKIAAFYDGSIIKDKRLQINGKSDMGLMNGTATWTATITPDLCSPSEHFKLRGEDKISRSLTGYQIESKVYVQHKDSGEEWFLLNANSDLAWSGNGTVKYTIPAAEHKLGRRGLMMSWAEITASMKLKPNDKAGLQAADWQFNAPEVKLKDGDGAQLLLQNISSKLDGTFDASTGDATSEVALGKLLLQAKKSGENVVFELDNLRQIGVQSGTEQALGLRLQTTADSVRYQNNTFTHFKFNTELKGLSQAAWQKWVDLNKRQGQECIKRRDEMQEMEQIVLLALKNGFTVDSKGNEVRLNGNHKATLDMAANFAAGEYANRQEAMRGMMDKVQYSLNAVVDKPLLDSLGLLNQGGVPMSDEDLDMMLAQVPAPFKAMREGQTIKFSVQK